jgi:four helix bundle protein
MENQIKIRTKKIGIEVIKLVDELPKKMSVLVISKQILRCSTSVGSNYRVACRAKSDADFLNKLRIVEEESDETSFWLEILEESNLTEPSRVEKLKKVVNEITSIMVASQKTMQNKIILKNGNRMKS